MKRLTGTKQHQDKKKSEEKVAVRPGKWEQAMTKNAYKSHIDTKNKTKPCFF